MSVEAFRISAPVARAATARRASPSRSSRGRCETTCVTENAKKRPSSTREEGDSVPQRSFRLTTLHLLVQGHFLSPWGWVGGGLCDGGWGWGFKFNQGGVQGGFGRGGSQDNSPLTSRLAAQHIPQPHLRAAPPPSAQKTTTAKRKDKGPNNGKLLRSKGAAGIG